MKSCLTAKQFWKNGALEEAEEAAADLSWAISWLLTCIEW